MCARAENLSFADIAATKLIDWSHWHLEEALAETIRTYRETISV
ncbi:MAG: hypothetical protein U0103_23980 [Candidatus Obscuribacterales bacterium]